MTDIEHAKKYAEESISLAISMYNPKAEIIAETACLYGLTYKNEQLTKAKDLLERLLITSCNSDVLNLLPNCSEVLRVRVEAEQFLSEV